MKHERRSDILTKELHNRIKWFINLRWFAVAALFLVITFSHYILKVELNLFQLYLGNVILFTYNILFYLISKWKNYRWRIESGIFANIQISLDLVMLTYLIYFSGDFENPFVWFYIFHMVIASILLTNKEAYLQAALASILSGGIMMSVYFNLIPHHHLTGTIPAEFCSSHHPYYVSKYFILVITLFFTVYMSTSIVNKLRKRENELEIVNVELKKQDRIKSEYVLTVSHDLKASLSAIQSCLKVVLSDYAGPVSEKAREMISRAEQRSLSLINFVDDLLNLSRIRASKSLDIKKISLSEVTNKIIEQFTVSLKQKNLDLSVKGIKNNYYTYASRMETESIFINLMLNAIKYTPSNGKIEINCKRIKKGKYFRITVSDTGIGILKEDLPYIYNDFFRAENAKEFNKEGTGLGLSIVKHIIDKMGCEIKAKSVINKGTSFIFELPVYI